MRGEERPWCFDELDRRARTACEQLRNNQRCAMQSTSIQILQLSCCWLHALRMNDYPARSYCRLLLILMLLTGCSWRNAIAFLIKPCVLVFSHAHALLFRQTTFQTDDRELISIVARPRPLPFIVLVCFSLHTDLTVRRRTQDGGTSPSKL